MLPHLPIRTAVSGETVLITCQGLLVSFAQESGLNTDRMVTPKCTYFPSSSQGTDIMVRVDNILLRSTVRGAGYIVQRPSNDRYLSVPNFALVETQHDSCSTHPLKPSIPLRRIPTCNCNREPVLDTV